MNELLCFNIKFEIKTTSEAYRKSITIYYWTTYTSAWEQFFSALLLFYLLMLVFTIKYKYIVYKMMKPIFNVN